MNEDVTKLSGLDKNDPELNQKTSELISNRMQEELRKSQLREEMRMAKAREEAKQKKEAREKENPQPKEEKVQEMKPQPTPQVEDNKDVESENEEEFVKTIKFKKVVKDINNSFSFLEKFIASQNEHNAKMDKFVAGLQNLINEYNKK